MNALPLTPSSYGYGIFGNLSENYGKARRNFPQELIMKIFSKLGSAHPSLLDMGCGTGIATQQLRQYGADVIGTDIDPEMIVKAKLHNPYNIKYLVASAERQPFTEKMFDGITAFSSFHWFAHEHAINEIKRLLKKRGIFFIINKNESGDFKKKNKAILQCFINEDMPDIKKTYDPKKILEDNEFSNVEEINYRAIEFFTPLQALEYVQSMSIWNLVPESKKTAALKALQNHFSEISENGLIRRALNVVLVYGTN